MRLARLFEDVVEFTRRGVAFDLSISVLPIAIQQPITKFRELLGREFLDFFFQNVHFAHGSLQCRFYAESRLGKLLWYLER